MKPGDTVGERTIIAADSVDGGEPAFALALTNEKPGCHYIIWALSTDGLDVFPDKYFSNFTSAVEEYFALT